MKNPLLRGFFFLWVFILMELYLTLIQLVVFLSYVGLIVKRYGIIPSISDSWYHLSIAQKGLFTLFTWGIGIPMLFYGNWLFFLSGAGFAFVGAATQFKSTLANTNKIHYGGAVVGILGALLGIWMKFDTILPLLWFIFTAVMLQVSYVKNKIWWQEIAAFVVIVLSLLMN